VLAIGNVGKQRGAAARGQKAAGHATNQIWIASGRARERRPSGGIRQPFRCGAWLDCGGSL